MFEWADFGRITGMNRPHAKTSLDWSKILGVGMKVFDFDVMPTHMQPLGLVVYLPDNIEEWEF